MFVGKEFKIKDQQQGLIENNSRFPVCTGQPIISKQTLTIIYLFVHIRLLEYHKVM